jgi:hypothetical protein
VSYVAALRARKRALCACDGARRQMHDAVDEAIGVYRAHPVPTLAGAAGIGFMLAQLRVGGGLVRAGVRIASGPAWQLVRQYITV